MKHASSTIVMIIYFIILFDIFFNNFQKLLLIVIQVRFNDPCLLYLFNQLHVFCFLEKHSCLANMGINIIVFKDDSLAKEFRGLVELSQAQMAFADQIVMLGIVFVLFIGLLNLLNCLLVPFLHYKLLCFFEIILHLFVLFITTYY